jgi:hypothetical protein
MMEREELCLLALRGVDDDDLLSTLRFSSGYERLRKLRDIIDARCQLSLRVAFQDDTIKMGRKASA